MYMYMYATTCMYVCMLCANINFIVNNYIHVMPSVKLACSYRRMKCLIRTLPAELPW